MSNNVKGKVKHAFNRKQWEEVIADIEHQLHLAKDRVEGLQKTLKNFIALRDSGMPWPGGGSNPSA